MIPPSVRTLAEHIGVTRVARVTTLDRAGVEVAAAIRPGGHVLQVTNGKGETFEQAARGAVLEAAELAFAERPDPRRLVFASRRALSRVHRSTAVWPATDLGSAGKLIAPELWSDEVVCAWTRAENLLDKGEVWVPAQAVYCPASDATGLGPVATSWTSNGSGAHTEPDQALLHALLEAAERDQLARMLPGGWTEEVVLERRLRPEALPPRAAAWVQRLSARGFDVALFDLTPEEEDCLCVPLAGALLVDRERGPIALTAGYACRLCREDALVAALLEAAQSRLTDIHGARDDVRHGADEGVDQLRSLLQSTGATRSLSQMPRDVTVTGRAAVRWVKTRMRKVGIDRAAAVWLHASPGKLQVVTVIIPSFQVSELLQ